MDVFVARQPIFNRHRRIFAYELLFRDGKSNAFPGVEGGIATSSLLSSSFFTFGIKQITGDHRAFINFTEEMLLRGIPAMFPPQSIVVEILEDVQPTDEVSAACLSLVEKGYMLALDDFVYAGKYASLLELAKIIKVDFMQCSIEQIREIVEVSKKYRCKLLAEKIETYEAYALATSMGFVYFQGYFFAKPEVLKNKEISSSQMVYMQLIQELFNVLGSDSSVSYRDVIAARGKKEIYTYTPQGDLAYLPINSTVLSTWRPPSALETRIRNDQ